MVSAKAYSDEMIRRLIAAGIKLREQPRTPIGVATFPVTDIDPGLEVVDSAVGPAVIAVRREFPNVA